MDNNNVNNDGMIQISQKYEKNLSIIIRGEKTKSRMIQRIYSPLDKETMHYLLPLPLAFGFGAAFFFGLSDSEPLSCPLPFSARFLSAKRKKMSMNLISYNENKDIHLAAFLSNSSQSSPEANY